jgi:superfamily II DNA or RNA helicase
VDYAEFIDKKRLGFDGCGFEPGAINKMLFPFQRDITRWALRLGRAAIFADCGLGKTPMQLEWAQHVNHYTQKPVLILAPLAVSHQTMREGEKFHIPVTICKTGDDIKDGINITNYERLHYFHPRNFGGIVLDESSILKGFDGKMRRQITDFANHLEYRLACTATPAPNDLIELTNHSEFLGVLSGKEIIALFFIQDGNTTHKWRLKKHAEEDFWKWLASWSVALRAPSDLGYDDDGFILPPLNIHDKVVESTTPSDGEMFVIEATTLLDRRRARRASLPDRVGLVADMVNRSGGQWLVWCDLNAESDALTKAITDAVEVRGSNTLEHKEAALLAFSAGEIRCLVTKPTIAGFGMNWQQCHNIAFVGLSDSYEQFYQAIRRCWRFGQEQEVNCHVVTATAEGRVVQNIKRKERQAREMFSNIVKHMKPYEDISKMEQKAEMQNRWDKETGEDWEMYCGDAVLCVKDIPNEVVGLTVFSPPFPGMYAYTDSPQDIGNSKNIEDLLEHYEFLVDDLLRVTMPGRSCAIHLTQEPVFKGKDGYVGLRDFRGDVIRLMIGHGWIFYGEATIDKDPQVKASRTKDHSLLFKTLSTDSTHCRPALADYLLQFMKPGENPRPVPSGTHHRWNPHGGWITPDEWIEWAAPVWYRQTPGHPGGIRETDVLNVRAGREDRDERHLCPLQLGVIERAVKLWSAPGDTVLSPFAGIGSEGFVSLQNGRKFIGIELKRSYFDVACDNLQKAKAQMGLFAK